MYRAVASRHFQTFDSPAYVCVVYSRTAAITNRHRASPQKELKQKNDTRDEEVASKLGIVLTREFVDLGEARSDGQSFCVSSRTEGAGAPWPGAATGD